MRTKTSSYFTKLIAYGLLIGTVPVLLIGAFAYQKAASSIQSKVGILHEQLLRQTQSAVESELLSIERAATAITSSSVANATVQRFVTSSDYAVADQLMEAMNSIRTNQFGTVSSSIISLSHSWVMSTHPYYPGYRTVNWEDKLAPYVQLPMTTPWLTEPYINPVLSIGDTGATSEASGITLVKKLPVHTINPSGLLLVHVPLAHVNRTLEFNTAQQERRDRIHYMIMDSHRNILASNGFVSDAGLIGQVKEIASQHDIGTHRIRLEHETYSLQLLRSPYNGWIYASVVSVSDIMKDSYAIGWYTLLLCAIIVIVIGFTAYWGSKRMYHPILHLYNLTIQNRTQVEQNRTHSDELTKIGDHMKAMVRNQEQMMGDIQRSMPQLQEYYTIKLLQGEMRAKEIKERMGQVERQTERQASRVFTIQIDTLEGTSYRESDLDLLLFAINNIVGELLKSSIRMVPVVYLGTQSVIIGSDTDSELDDKNRTYHLAEWVCQHIEKFLKLQVTVGISSIYRELENTHRAWVESREALKYRLRYREQQILYFEDVCPEYHSLPEYPQKHVNALVDAVKLGNHELSIEHMRTLAAHILESDRTHQDMMIVFTRLSLELIQIGREAGSEMQLTKAGEASLTDQLEKLKSIEAIVDWFAEKLLLPLTQWYEQKHDRALRKISNDVLEHIHMHYDSPLTLEGVAAQLHYHPAYVSKIFKEETGMTFTEALSKQRFTIAKQWLRDTDMTIAEISERLQFYSAANFSRYFKNQEGVTPGRYRELSRE